MSDENAKKAQIRAYNEITRADYTPESIEAAIGKLWRAAVASRDAEVAAERTRADKAEAEMHSRELHHFEVEEENESLRGVIERVSAWAHEIAGEEPVTNDFKKLNRILEDRAEPQGEVDTTRERIARNGDMVLRGQGVISDRNGPFRLSLKVDGIWQPVILNTHDWNVEWAEPQGDHEGSQR